MMNTNNKLTMTLEQFQTLMNHVIELAHERGLSDEEILHELADKMEELAKNYRLEG